MANPDEHAGSQSGGPGSTLALFLTVGLVGLVLLAHLRIVGPIIDDAYITFRYAAKLAAGEGLVYNLGERVLGTTTPGFAVLLAALAAVFGAAKIPATALLVNVSLLITTGLIAGRVGARLTGNPLAGAAVAGLFLITPHTMVASLAGMETPLFLLLTVGSMAALLGGHYGRAAIAAGASVCVRPEGAILIALMALAVGLRLWREPNETRVRSVARAGMAFLMPGALWAGVATWYYGSPIPQSIVAKRAGLYPMTVDETVAELVRGMSFAFFGTRTPILALVLVLFLVITVGAFRLLRMHADLWVLPAWLFTLLIFYGSSGTFLFEHYYALFEPYAFVCVWVGLAVALGKVGSWIPSVGSGRRAGVGAGMIVMLMALAGFPFSSIAAGRPVAGDRPFNAGISRHVGYAELVSELGPSLPPGTVMALPEIGLIGFYLDAVRVLDTAGLVSPEATPFFPVPSDQRASARAGAIPVGLIRQTEPDMLATLEFYGRHGILDDAWFAQRYVLIRSMDGPWLPSGTGPLLVFARNDFEPGLALHRPLEV